MSANWPLMQSVRNNTPLSSDEFAALLAATGIDSQGVSCLGIAISGGADSLALVYLAHTWARAQGKKIIALTVDHKLRPESTQEAISVQHLMHTWEVEHHILTWEGPKPSTRLQEQARQARYNLLEAFCYECGIPLLLMGHHQADQEETALMRLRQGTNLLGLAAMRPLTYTQRCQVVRPFLNTHPDRLRATLKAVQIPWIEDPSNHNPHYERTRWRTKKIPQILSSSTLQSLRTHLERWVRGYLKRHGHHSSFGSLTLEKEALLALPPEFQVLLLSYILRGLGVKKYPPSLQTLEGLLTRLKQKDFKAVTAQGLRLSATRGTFLFVREYRAITHEHDIIAPSKHFVWDGRFLIHPSPEIKGAIRAIGEKGWLQLIQHNPSLKAMTLARPLIWSLPGLWQKDQLDPHWNMIEQTFLPQKDLFKKKMFVFAPQYPFQALFF
jgi:tRNA(Ile)-lysidine synthase